MESTNDHILKRQLFDLINMDGGEPQEFAAREGFGLDRIMDYAELTGAMLNEHGTGTNSTFFDPRFWENHWIPTGQYNQDHDNDTTSHLIHTASYRATAIIFPPPCLAHARQLQT